MDRRDAMQLSGSASYFMQQGLTGSGPGAQSGLLGSPGMHSLSNSPMPFQPNIGSGSIQPTLATDHSSGMSSQGMGAATPSAVLPSEPVRRKRGRPRKYGPDGTVSLGLSSSSSSAPPGMVTSPRKRGRGRPPGSGRKHQVASFGELLSGSPGFAFTPHVLAISVGEDIAMKIKLFSQQGPRAICILSATGAVSTVTLRHQSTSGGNVTYEGRFEIISLSGSYLISNTDSSPSGSLGLTVSLASPDGHVIGGGVVGMLIAASPVQVIVGSFLLGNPKNKNKGGEGTDSGRQSDIPRVDEEVTPSSVPTQNITPTPSAGAWSNMRQMHLRDSNVDIDLMRG